MAMKLTYSVQEFDDKIEQAYRILLPHQITAIDAGILKWKFQNNPAGPGLVAVCRTGEGEIVGINGFQPGRFQNNSGNQFLAYQSMDTIVSPKARGQGVFSHLLEEFYKSNNGDVIYGFPNSQSARGFFGRLGWTNLGTAPYLVRPVRSAYFGRKLLKSFPDFKLPSFSAKPGNSNQITRFDERANKAQAATIPQNSTCLVRSSDYLNWRIFDKPDNDYVVLTDDHQAYVIGSVAEKHGGNIGYILDAFGTPKLLPGLIAAMVNYQSEKNADVVLSWCLPHSANRQAFRNAGFFNLPNRLRPIEINFGARNLSPNSPDMILLDDWYISYLDSDTV